MFKDVFPKSNGSGMLNHILDVYGREVPKSVFDSMGCGGDFYITCLTEGRIKIVHEGYDPIVRIERSYENFCNVSNHRIR
jgi:hypothetical protein